MANSVEEEERRISIGEISGASSIENLGWDLYNDNGEINNESSSIINDENGEEPRISNVSSTFSGEELGWDLYNEGSREPSTTAGMSGGIEIMDDDEDAPRPLSYTHDDVETGNGKKNMAGIEVLGNADDDDLPLPYDGALLHEKMAGGIEVLDNDDDNDLPLPHGAFLSHDTSKSKKDNESSGTDTRPPAKNPNWDRITSTTGTTGASSRSTSLMNPPSNNPHWDEGRPTNHQLGVTAIDTEGGPEEEEREAAASTSDNVSLLGAAQNRMQQIFTTNTNTNNDNTEENNSNTPEANNGDNGVNIGQSGLYEVPVAHLVEEDQPINAAVQVHHHHHYESSAAHAEPLIIIPWWKQRKTKLLIVLIVVLILAVAVAAIVSAPKEDYAGEETPLNDDNTAVEEIEVTSWTGTEEHTTISRPTSAKPSRKPTISPTQPMEKVVSYSINTLPVNITTQSAFDMDGNNIVLAHFYDESRTVHIDFYSLEESSWSFKQRITKTYEKSNSKMKVAISGETAIVSLPSGRNEFVFRMDNTKGWQSSSGFPAVPCCYIDMGLTIGIDGDLAVVTGQILAFPQTRVYVHRQVGGEFNYTTLFDPDAYVIMKSMVAGNTFAFLVDDKLQLGLGIALVQARAIHIYHYNEETESVSKVQEITATENILGAALSENYVVYFTPRDDSGRFDIFVYHRQDPNDSFSQSWDQQLGPFDEEGGSIAMDLYMDILVVTPAGSNNVYIYKLQDGQFGPSLIIVIDWYWPSENFDIRISGRNVVALDKVGKQISYFEIDDDRFIYSGIDDNTAAEDDTQWESEDINTEMTGTPEHTTSTQPTTAQPSRKPSSKPFSIPPTSPPTPIPTPKPTVDPTNDPTDRPTPKLALRPTTLPPTAFPSKKPTAEPSKKPTLPPTAFPTKQRTDDPTLRPTTLPPTAFPSKKPTAEPSKKPTLPPTAFPTKQPTDDPTLRPTTLPPTAFPSKKPTAEPSKKPTLPPTAFPTKQPTDDPTLRPTTLPPTAFPSKKPTAEPSKKPTLPPTAFPTKQPTDDPTLRPTTLPPTSLPTTLPPTPQPSPNSTPQLLTPAEYGPYTVETGKTDTFGFSSRESGLEVLQVPYGYMFVAETSKFLIEHCEGQAQCGSKKEQTVSFEQWSNCVMCGDNIYASTVDVRYMVHSPCGWQNAGKIGKLTWSAILPLVERTDECKDWNYPCPDFSDKKVVAC